MSSSEDDFRETRNELYTIGQIHDSAPLQGGTLNLMQFHLSAIGRQKASENPNDLT